MARGKGRPAEKHRKRPKHTHQAARKAGRTQPWETADDIPLDSEEQFHKNLDKILLNGDDESGADAHGWSSEDEVFKLEGLPESSDEEGSDVRHSANEASDDGDEPGFHRKLPQTAAPTNSKSRNITLERDSGESSYDSAEELERWGAKKATYYSTNAPLLSSDDEEGNELEEKEALRLQMKARKDVTEDDFGLEMSWNEEVTEEGANCFDEISAPDPKPSVQDKASLLRHLEVNSPETLALAREWGEITHDLVKVEAALTSLSPENPSLGLVHLHHQTLLTYATTLAFYLYLCSHAEIASQPNQLRSHPIMNRLLTLKQALSELDALGFSAIDDDDIDDSEAEDEETFALSVPQWGRMDILDPQNILQEIGKSEPVPKTIKRSKKRDKLPVQRSFKTTSQPFDLVEPKFVGGARSSQPTAAQLPVLTDSDYGEQLSLEHSDMKDKDARRKSLKFYTAKIASASGRRERARAAIGGDDDIPYKERRKDKEARLAKDPTLGMGGDDLEPLESSLKRARPPADDSDPAGEDESGYYDLVKRRKKELKEEKKLAYEAERETDKLGLDTSKAEGPRSLTRAILTNKGLTPRRAKAARNPRVKKRQQFEKAKRKLSSKKATYKGGLSNTGGHYEGEKSGIASRVVKSVKLS